jgi:hypothetical protein
MVSVRLAVSCQVIAMLPEVLLIRLQVLTMLIKVLAVSILAGAIAASYFVS